MIPFGFEINDDENYRAKRGEIFYTLDGHQEAGIVIGYTGYKVAQMRQDGYILIRPISKPLTPEEKLKIAKEKSKLFIKEHINNPKPETFEKFESAFLREDNFGL